MILFREALSLTDYIKKQKSKGCSTGFVPTMGALHEGHLSLIAHSKKNTDITVASIFVNPTQFNDKKDFEKYPVTISDDIQKLIKGDCDVLFLPTVEEIYPNGTGSPAHYDLGYFENIYEGAYRPGHFQGVCQVMDRLLTIVEPGTLFLGQKDFQQCKVIERLIDLIQLPVKLLIVKTTREPSGLAMSSRNTWLSEAEKEKALAIYESLVYIKQHYKTTPFDGLIKNREGFLKDKGFSKIDYVSVADADTLQPVMMYDNTKKHVALIAAFIGRVRLIDNMLLEDEAL